MDFIKIPSLNHVHNVTLSFLDKNEYTCLKRVCDIIFMKKEINTINILILNEDNLCSTIKKIKNLGSVSVNFTHRSPDIVCHNYIRCYICTTAPVCTISNIHTVLVFFLDHCCKREWYVEE